MTRLLLSLVASALCGTLALTVSASGAPDSSPVAAAGPLTRHEAKVAAARSHPFGMLMIGDSITHNLEEPAFAEVWKRHYAARDALNLGYGGYRTDSILRNLRSGELDRQNPKLITLLIGTNDLDDANYKAVLTPEGVLEGTRAIVNLLREKCPEAKILVLRLFPREIVYRGKDGRERGNAKARAAAVLRAGELTRSLADGKHVFWLDLNHLFLRPDGTLDPRLMPDRLHPSPEGAEVWAKAMAPVLDRLAAGEPLR